MLLQTSKDMTTITLVHMLLFVIFMKQLVHISKLKTLKGMFAILSFLYNVLQSHNNGDRKMQLNSIKKIPGKSWLVDNNGNYHEFLTNDQVHHESKR